MPGIDQRFKKVLKNVLEHVKPENDLDYMRYTAISDRITLLEKFIHEALQPKKKERAPRGEQLAKERCIAIAKLLWKENPNYTIAQLSTHPAICNTDITGGSNYAQRTLSNWIAEADVRPIEAKLGRPSKQKLANIPSSHI